MGQRVEKLFSRANLHSLFWGCVMLAVGAIGTKLYLSIFGEEPQEVIVKNFPQTTVVTEPVRPPDKLDTATAEELRKMLLATQETIKELRATVASANASQKADLERRIVQLELRELAVEKARAAAPTTPSHPRPMPPTMVALSIIEKWPYKPYATIAFPTTAPPDYKPPDAYILNGRPKLFKDPRCPPSTPIPGQSRVRVSFSIATVAQIARMSPLIVKVLRDEPDNQLKQYFEATVAPTVGANVIELDSNFEPGKHLLRVGYLLKDEKAKDLPTLYTLTCDVNVLEPGVLMITVQ